jgi:hypothetical protein
MTSAGDKWGHSVGSTSFNQLVRCRRGKRGLRGSRATFQLTQGCYPKPTTSNHKWRSRIPSSSFCFTARQRILGHRVAMRERKSTAGETANRGRSSVSGVFLSSIIVPGIFDDHQFRHWSLDIRAIACHRLWFAADSHNIMASSSGRFNIGKVSLNYFAWSRSSCSTRPCMEYNPRDLVLHAPMEVPLWLVTSPLTC